jgi:hypothetical protein
MFRLYYRNNLLKVKDLRKIIALFLFIFVVGTAVIIGSINQKLDSNQTQETVEISKDSTQSESKEKKTV